MTVWFKAPSKSAIATSGEFVDGKLVRRFLNTSRLFALIATSIGVLVLIGWEFNIGWMKSIRPDLGAMAPSSAVAFVIAGTTLMLMHPARTGTWLGHIANYLPVIALLISGLSLAEYLFVVDFGIDQIFFTDPDQSVQTEFPGRMSMAAALGFSLLGVAMLLIRSRSRFAQQVARIMALVTLTMSVVGLLGFIYGRPSLYAVPLFTGVAIHTVVALMLLAAALLLIQPAKGFSTMLVSAGAGGQLSRRLLPYAIAIPLVLGWLRLEGERIGLYRTEMGVDLMVVVMVVIFVALIWSNARLLDSASAEKQRAEEKLLNYAEAVSDLYERAPCGYHSLDADGVFIRINDTELSWLGYSREEIVGKLKFSDLLTEDSKQVFQARFPQFKVTGEIKDIEFDMRRKDGSLLPVSFSATAAHDASGNFVMSRSIVFDITDRRRAEQELRDSDEKVRRSLEEIEQIYRYAPVGLFIFDGQYRFIRINERMAEINGLPPAAHIGKSMWEVVPALADELKETFRPVYEQGKPVLDVEIHGCTPRDPETIHHWLGSYFPLKSDSGEVIGMIGAVLDITERKRIEQVLRDSEIAIRTIALTDALTGLANRRRLDEALRYEIQRAQRYGSRLTVVITDLDHFKKVNDIYGHQVGDAVLKEFARLVRTHCRETDLVARFGGEEFLILMPEVGAVEAQACAERIRSSLAQTVMPPLSHPNTASFGVAELMPNENEESLLRRADKALYQCKTAGRNCVGLAENV